MSNTALRSFGFLEDVPMPGVGVYYMIYRLKPINSKVGRGLAFC